MEEINPSAEHVNYNLDFRKAFNGGRYEVCKGRDFNNVTAQTMREKFNTEFRTRFPYLEVKILDEGRLHVQVHYPATPTPVRAING